MAVPFIKHRQKRGNGNDSDLQIAPKPQKMFVAAYDESGFSRRGAGEENIVARVLANNRNDLFNGYRM